MNASIYDLELDGEDEQLKRLPRPQSLDDFVGANEVRENLRVFIGAARQRQEALDHVLLHGPPGLGKTTLAHILSHELKVGLRVTSGPVLNKAGDLVALLNALQPRDVLFIDEIHRVHHGVLEALYPAMEDFCIDLMVGEGVTARSLRLDLPPFTLVAATTRSGRLSAPFRDRFGIHVNMQLYPVEALCRIVQRSAALMEARLNQVEATMIAKRSRGTPRTALRLLKRVRDHAQYYRQSFSSATISRALKALDIDEDGLDTLDRRYLTILLERRNQAVGLDTISALLGEERNVIEDVLEPFLLQGDYIRRTPRGRILGAMGLKKFPDLDQMRFS